MDSAEFASIIENFPVIRSTDFIADAWVTLAMAALICVDSRSESNGSCRCRAHGL